VPGTSDDSVEKDGAFYITKDGIFFHLFCSANRALTMQMTVSFFLLLWNTQMQKNRDFNRTIVLQGRLNTNTVHYGSAKD
jgi:hypothetical protein